MHSRRQLRGQCQNMIYRILRRVAVFVKVFSQRINQCRADNHPVSLRRDILRLLRRANSKADTDRQIGLTPSRHFQQ